MRRYLPYLCQNFLLIDELQDAFYDLMKDFKKINIKNRNLKEMNQMLTKEKKEALNKQNKLKKENEALKK